LRAQRAPLVFSVPAKVPRDEIVEAPTSRTTPLFAVAASQIVSEGIGPADHIAGAFDLDADRVTQPDGLPEVSAPRKLPVFTLSPPRTASQERVTKSRWMLLF
jgi:hypothetical protein